MVPVLEHSVKAPTRGEFLSRERQLYGRLLGALQKAA